MAAADLLQKFEQILQAYPWESAWLRLFADPTPPERLPLGDAQEIVSRERYAQLPTLFSLMYTPIVEPGDGSARAPDDPQVARTHFRLRGPRRTARLFVERAVLAGQNLRQFRAEELGRLDDRRDSALGRLLRLLAIADGLPSGERRIYRAEWADLVYLEVDVGPVLTPMLRATTQTTAVRETERLRPADILARQLAQAADQSGRRLARKSLGQWTASLIRQGAARLQELGADLRD